MRSHSLVCRKAFCRHLSLPYMLNDLNDLKGAQLAQLTLSAAYGAHFVLRWLDVKSACHPFSTMEAPCVAFMSSRHTYEKFALIRLFFFFLIYIVLSVLSIFSTALDASGRF